MAWNPMVLVAIITASGVLGGAFIENGTGVLCEIGITECKPDQSALDSRDKTITDLRERLDIAGDERRVSQDKYIALLEILAEVKNEVTLLSETLAEIEKSTGPLLVETSRSIELGVSEPQLVNLCDANPEMCMTLDNSILRLNLLSDEIDIFEIR